MTERQFRILAALVNEYVKNGELVSSGFLAGKYSFGIKTASIRNEMMELEGAGYLSQPHTSAGRMPTDRAYRLLVNRIKDSGLCRADAACRRKIDRAVLDAGCEPRNINRALAETLSELSDSLVITNIIGSNDFFKTGFSSLFEFREFKQTERVFNLANFLDNFDKFFHSLAQDFFSDSDFSVCIGRENSDAKMKNETVMMAKYNLPRRLTGSITLVGPIRMDYGRNMGLMKYAAERVNDLAKRT